MDNKVIIFFSTILTVSSGLITVIKFVKELVKESRLKRKPLFFVHELLLKGFSTEQNHYQLKGRLVSKDDVDFESMNFELPPGDEWEGNSKYYRFEKQVDGWKQIGEGASLSMAEGKSKNNTLSSRDKNLGNEKSENLNIGKHYSYDIEGRYVAINDIKGKYLAKDDTYKSLKISLIGVNNKKEDIKDLKIIKCPNIREKWLKFYIVLSMLVIFIGVSSTLITFNQNWNYILNADFWLKSVFFVYGFLMVLTTVYFMYVNMKCVSQYIVLLRMKKYGVPVKTKIVSDKLLIPKTIEFMAGTENVDNML